MGHFMDIHEIAQVSYHPSQYAHAQVYIHG